MKAIAMLGLVLALFASAPGAHAATASGDDVAISTPVQGDLLAAGRSVEVHARIGGDLAVAGRRVAVAGPVEGYVLAAGADVSITGPVGDDVWAAGRDVVVRARIGDNARLAGASVLLEREASVGGNALLTGRHVEVRAPVAKDLLLRAGDATIASEIGGSVRARTGRLHLAPGAVIHGDLVIWGPDAPDIAPGAKVLGQVKHHEASATTSGVAWWWQWVFGFLSLLLLGAVVIALSRNWGTRVAEKLRDRFGASLITGVIALFVIPLLVALLMASGIGMPLAVVGLAFYGAVLLLSGVWVALRIGAWLLGRSGRPAASRYARLALGALVLAFVAALPWVGWIAWLLVPLLGMGALLLERRDAWRSRPV